MAAVQQNIANWYQYHRRRAFVAKAAVAEVMEHSPFFRFGIGSLHDEFFEPLPEADLTDYIPHNQDVLNTLLEWNWQAQGTNLREGLQIAGEYFRGNRSPYDTSLTKPITHQCQQNFTILFTDGFWTNGTPPSGIADEDHDGVSVTVADVAKFYWETDLDAALADIVPTSVFDDQNQQHMVTFTVAFGVNGTLSDSDGDGWPDLVLDTDGIAANEAKLWTTGSYTSTGDMSDAEKIDDMWHAAYNSRGTFISAKSPGNVVDGLNEALSAIADRVGNASSAAASTGATVLTDTNVFFAHYDSHDWTGELVAYEIEVDPFTGAATKINPQNATTNLYANTRSNFFSYKPATHSKIDFEWDNLDSSQQAFLNDDPDSTSIDDDGFGNLRLAYVTDDTSYDGVDVDASSEVTVFRNRNDKTLGDVLNAAPQYVGKPFGFINSDLHESSTFPAFKAANAGRKHMLYLGANDGKLHALLADSDPADKTLDSYGKEVFSYIPSAVIKRLNRLTATEYIGRGTGNHRYFVDGSPRVSNAYVGSWKTVLVGGLGAGGQGIYALDVTDGASSPTKDNIVMWEFNDSDDADLGYTYSRPVIARLKDGNWYAIVGNGYNNTEVRDMDVNVDANVSTTGHAVLFILKLSGPGSDGVWDLNTDYFKLDTGVGSTITPNGLSSLAVLDSNRDQVVDSIYAGDLLGNLWRFDLDDGPGDDLSGSKSINEYGDSATTAPSAVTTRRDNPNSGAFTAATLKIAYGGLPVFTAQTGQPITSAPVIGFHPLGGYMIYFGTGQFLEAGDNNQDSQATQSLYGIWDQCAIKYSPTLPSDQGFALSHNNLHYLKGTSCGLSEQVSVSDLLQQSIYKEETLVDFFEFDANGNGTIEDEEKFTETVRTTTNYGLLTPAERQLDVASSTILAQMVTDYSVIDDSVHRNLSPPWAFYDGWFINGDPADPLDVTTTVTLSKKGWYLDLISETQNGIDGLQVTIPSAVADDKNLGERNINPPLLIGGAILFNTYIPGISTVECGVEGDTWLIALDAIDGSHMGFTPFDLNRSNSLDTGDLGVGGLPISGVKIGGFTPPVTIVHGSGTDHTIAVGEEDDGIGGLLNLKDRNVEGRQTWRPIN